MTTTCDTPQIVSADDENGDGVAEKLGACGNWSTFTPSLRDLGIVPDFGSRRGIQNIFTLGLAF